jgi:hypothetical protein
LNGFDYQAEAFLPHLPALILVLEPHLPFINVAACNVTKAEIKEMLKNKQAQKTSLAELKFGHQQFEEQVTAQLDVLHQTISILCDRVTTNTHNQRRFKKHVSRWNKFTAHNN